MEPRKYYVFRITHEGESNQEIKLIDIHYNFSSAKEKAIEMHRIHKYDLHPAKHFYVSDDLKGWD